MRHMTWCSIALLTVLLSTARAQPIIIWNPQNLPLQFFLPPPPQHPAPPPSNGVLLSGQQLVPGQLLFSPAGNHVLAMQTDSNLVLYRVRGPGSLVPTWSTRTNTIPPEGVFCAMQGDGNFVLYNGRTPLFNSRTAGSPGAILAVQDDGNLVVYQGTTPLWATGTNGQ